jgi:hypothetical protein
VAFTRHRPYPMMMVWTFVIEAVCLAPIAMWLFDRTRAARQERRSAREEKQSARHAGSHRSKESAEADLTSAAG